MEHETMARVGYARVSSKSQDHANQVASLKAAGCDKIYSEKASGKSTDGRREFQKMMKALQPGDTVVVVKLDRMARSSRDLANTLHALDQLDVGFTSLGETWCDTTTSAGRLMVTIMSGIAQFERELIQQRCDEGIERARSKGVRFGRKPKLSPSEIKVAAERYAKGETLREIGADYHVSEATMSRALS
jgi:DNA invertase Pin-like site-specific DNA recombinase